MLCINSYPQDYIEDCRARIQAQVAAYQNLVITTRTQTTNEPLDSAIESFEWVFFNNMVLVLDQLFVHRSRMLEKKDGNPLNEVRLLCQSLLTSDSKLSADKAIKYEPSKSVLKLRFGDEIKLREGDFIRLAEAFFAEIEIKFLQPEFEPMLSE